MKLTKQAQNKIYFYENFINERNLEKVADENELNKISTSMCLMIISSTVAIGFSAILGMSEINVLNIVLLVFSLTNFISALFFYVCFIRKTVDYNLFKGKIYALVLPLPLVLLTFAILSLGTYNTILTQFNRRDLMFLGTWNVFVPILVFDLAYVVFSCYAYVNCFSDYFLKRKPRLDQVIHR